MYYSLKDKQVDDDLLEAEEIASIGYSKAQQLGKPKKKKESTFGKRASTGTFGKKPAVWNNNKKSTTPKVKKSDILDKKYKNWLAKKPCVVTGIIAERGIGASNIHIHHIYSRNKGTNDYLSVPLIGYMHSWNNNCYHSNTKKDYIRKNNIMTDNIIEYFLNYAQMFIDEYVADGNSVLCDYKQITELINENIEKSE